MDDEQIVDDATTTDIEEAHVTEDDLRDLKYNQSDVETAEAEDESESEEQEEQEEVSVADSDQIAPTFTKKFPNIQGDTPEEYSKNLEAAYENSTAEFHRLRQSKPETEEKTDESPKSLADIYFQQQLDKEIGEAFATVQKDYPQINDKAEYDKFTTKVNTLSKVILDTEGRLAPPSELYRDAAVSLGWHKESALSESEKLGLAVKSGAAVSKTTSATKAPVKSKVTEEMMILNRKMYPGKSDAEIRKELEEYIN